MIDPFGFTKTEVAIFEMGETSGWSMGVRAERERITKLLEDVKADFRKKLSEVSGDSQSETYWYSRIQQLDNYIALIKGSQKDNEAVVLLTEGEK